jgi:GGDEF domain-containing protein
MDGFNYIYDNYRHNTGDKLLVCSQHMRDALRECDTLEFIGGDEFMVELDDLEMPNDCKPTLERLQKVASQTICLSDVLLNFSAGMDVAKVVRIDTIFDIHTSIEARRLHKNINLLRQAFAQVEFFCTTNLISI